MNFDAVKNSLVAEAKRAGLEEYEVYFMESSGTSAETLKGEISSFSSEVSGGISFRCIVGGKMGSASTELFSDDEMKALVARAIENAKNIESDDKAVIFGGSEKYAELMEFIDSMLNYHEEGRYIFTHGWLPTIFEGYRPTVDPAWRDADAKTWEKSHWSQWQQFYRAGALVDGKIIVCGHRPARLGYWYDESRYSDDDSPFFGNGVIAIDTYTVKSGRVEVLVLEDLS